MNVFLDILGLVIFTGVGYTGGRFHEAYLNTNAREARQLAAVETRKAFKTKEVAGKTVTSKPQRIASKAIVEQVRQNKKARK